MSGGVPVGLEFGLSAWQRGVGRASDLVRQGLGAKTLRPFDKAVMASQRGLNKLGEAGKRAMSAVFSPIGAAVAGAASLAGIQQVLSKSLAAYRDHGDSVVILEAALRRLGDIDTGRAVARVDELGTRIRAALGIGRTETNKVFADLITGGFDEAQARQLTILAANFAKKTGQPLAQAARLVGEAANGNVAALRRMGVEVQATGNAVRDAEAAVLAMHASYGDIGADLANPSERLSAAWGDLYVVLGEKVGPLLEPLIEGVADLVSGFAQTEEGQRYLDGIAQALGTSIEFTKEFTGRLGSLFVGAKEGAHAFFEFLSMGLARQGEHIASIIEMLSFGKVDLSGFRATMAEMAKISLENAEKRAVAGGAALDRAFGSDANAGEDLLGLGSVQRAGRELRERSREELRTEQQAGMAAGGFAGQRAVEAERRKAEAQAAREEEARRKAEERNSARLSGMGEARGGMSVRIVSTKPDRFRKARSR